ncbi:hypothetical protein NX059_007482 [Plenodomus lindquistii]|nr:hypothetical protein NX059_007482 [Plenodomus lindquistii]
MTPVEANILICFEATPTADMPPKASFRNKWATRLTKIQLLTLSYDNVGIDEIISYAARTWWRGLRNNQYQLPPAFYLVVFIGLTAWTFGSIVCGYFEAMARLHAKDMHAVWPAFWRGVIGAIPGLTGIISFLFPPLFCVRQPIRYH